jgi:hypothetical protein
MLRELAQAAAELRRMLRQACRASIKQISYAEEHITAQLEEHGTNRDSTTADAACKPLTWSDRIAADSQPLRPVSAGKEAEVRSVRAVTQGWPLMVAPAPAADTSRFETAAGLTAVQLPGPRPGRSCQRQHARHQPLKLPFVFKAGVGSQNGLCCDGWHVPSSVACWPYSHHTSSAVHVNR